jgi:hypothetical protein
VWRESNWKAPKSNIGDGFAGTHCRIHKSEIVVSLGCTVISDLANSLSDGEGFTLLDRTLLILFSDWTKR